MGSGMIILIVIAVVVLMYIVIYNGLVSRRTGVENGWSQIDVQLKRRHDLIPNLVETVKGYAAHEKDTLERVINARNRAVTSSAAHDTKEQIVAENALSGALRQIFALSENYPDLKANQNFSQLQEEITSTENRIGFARQHYNDTVADYNAAIQKIPANIVANTGGFTRKEFWTLDPSEQSAAQQPPKVSF